MLTHLPPAQGAFLGCGLQGFTILATDTLQGDEVAIKVLRCNDYVISLINQALDYMFACSIPLRCVSSFVRTRSQRLLSFAEYTACPMRSWRL